MREPAEERLLAYQTHNHLTLNDQLALDLLLCLLSGCRPALYVVPSDAGDAFRQELERVCRFVVACRSICVPCDRTLFTEVVAQVMALPVNEPPRVFSQLRPAVLQTSVAHLAVKPHGFGPGFSSQYNPDVIREQLADSADADWGKALMGSLADGAAAMPEGFLPKPASLQHGATVVLLERLDAASHELQHGLLELLQSRRIFHNGQVRQLPDNIMFVATLGSHETKDMNARLRDFFMLSGEVPNLPSAGLAGETSAHYLLAPVYDRHELERMQVGLQSTFLEPDIARYLRDICMGLRTHRDVAYGPTGQAITDCYLAVRAWAYLNGRDFVTPSHVADIAQRILQHRPSLMPAVLAAADDGQNVRERILREVIDQTTPPA